MYCRKCGRQIADDAAFCSYCGTPTELGPAEPVIPEVPEVQPDIPAVEDVRTAPVEAEPEEIVARKPIFEEFQWNVNDYPDNNSFAKTEDIDFDWNADPNDIRDRYSEQREEPSGFDVDDIIPGGRTAPADEKPAESEMENMSASERIDKFYTFNRKNEEFQQLLNREYQKVKAGSAISYELSEADSLANERFENREPDTSMDAFLRREGVEKPYEPKPFETDVLDRIEAQEEAREMQRREEEARQAALEQARKEAEEKMRLEEEARAKAEEEARIRAEEQARIRAEEEARIKAEEAFREAERLKEEARLRAEEVARFKAEEEARLKAEEEARIRAEEEARIKAEEEARARAEEEARLKAEEEARIKAEELAREEARIKAEAELRAAREAEKIKAQREARMAVEAQERERAEQERRKAEEARLKAKLEEEQAALAKRAEDAAVEQEARKVLEQTARMREAEAEKIRAAIAGIKGEIASKPEPVQPEAPVRPAAPEPGFTRNTIVPEPVKPAAPAQPAAPEPGFTRETVVPEPVQFADTVAILRGNAEIEKAHNASNERISKMAQAREDFFAGFEPEERTPIQPPVEKPQKPVVKPAEDLAEKPKTGRDTMLSAETDLTRTRAIDKAEILAGMEKTKRLEKAELNAREDKEFFESLQGAQEEIPQVPEAVVPETTIPEPEVPAQPEAEPMDIRNEQETVEDLLSQFETANHLPENQATAEIPDMPEETVEPAAEPEFQPVVEPAVEPVAEPEPVAASPEAEAEIPAEGFAAKEEPGVVPDAKASEEVKPGLDDTMIMPESQMAKDDLMKDFDSYGEEEAAQLRAQQEAEAEEIKAQQEAKAAEEAEDEKEGKKGGKGKVVLKVILVLLIIIFAIELAGIGIKFLAPQSQAAETIDNQLNKIIHLITGEENTTEDITIV